MRLAVVKEGQELKEQLDCSFSASMNSSYPMEIHHLIQYLRDQMLGFRVEVLVCYLYEELKELSCQFMCFLLFCRPEQEDFSFSKRKH